MSRQSEFKKRFDPELGRYTRQHIYGEGITDVFKSFGSKLFGKTMKKAAKKGVEKAVTAAATNTGEHVGKKAGDKIVQMLSKEKPPKKVTFSENIKKIPYNQKVNTILSENIKTIPNNRNQINKRVNAILSGGSILNKKKLYNY